MQWRCTARFHKGNDVAFMLSELVGDYHKFGYVKQMFKQNFYLVSTDSLKSDGPTLPPLVKQRGAGCPKTKRIRHQSKYRLGEDSPIICSNCRRRGHNKRTCPNQKMLPIESATTTGNNVVVVNLPPDEEARSGKENEDEDDR